MTQTCPSDPEVEGLEQTFDDGTIYVLVYKDIVEIGRKTEYEATWLKRSELSTLIKFLESLK